MSKMGVHAYKGVLCNNKKESRLTKKAWMPQREPHSIQGALWGDGTAWECRAGSIGEDKEGWGLLAGMIEMSVPSTNTHLQRCAL